MSVWWLTYYYYYYYTHFTASSPEKNLGNRYQKGKTSLDLNEADLNEARDDGVWDAVASAGPYANNLHLAPDR